jgi:hypothetical protein
VRGALRGLESRNADSVARHLVAAGGLVDEDPQAALAHARAARDRASRVAVVREAVGVAAYHAGDYAEAARELRAYRRMSGDEGYRAVLADCERALGRPDVALRLVAEALADHPDPAETVELRLVESGARRDLGQDRAAALVIEAALGGRPRLQDLRAGDLPQLRLATAYADLLAAQGEEARAAEWFAAIAAADPEDLTGSWERAGIEFSELDEADADEDSDDAGEGSDDSDEDAEASADVTVGDPAPEADGQAAVPGGDRGYDLDADVEAEVAELLGEDADSDDATADDGDPAEGAPDGSTGH